MPAKDIKLLQIQKQIYNLWNNDHSALSLSIINKYGLNEMKDS
jgi:hypothetical protein